MPCSIARYWASFFSWRSRACWAFSVRNVPDSDRCFMRWGTVKEAAAVSAAFIWVNSAAALAGGLSQGFTLPPDLFVLVGVAFTGGLLGAYFGSARFTNTVLLRTLASVLAIAGIKLLVS